MSESMNEPTSEPTEARPITGPEPTPLWMKVMVAVGIIVGLTIMFRVGVSENKSAQTRTATTIGRITQIHHRSGEKQDYYFCTVKFEDTDNRTFTATSPRVKLSKAPKWKVGDIARVAYDPADPSNNSAYIE